jgi:hypothetical protein
MPQPLATWARLGLRIGSSVLLAIMAFWLLTSAQPLQIEAMVDTAHVVFSTDYQAVLFGGGCVTVRWHTEYIKEIYLNGEGQIGNGERRLCIVPDAVPTLTVRFVDGTTRSYTLPVRIIVSSPVFQVAAGSLLLGFWLILQLSPVLSAYRRTANRLVVSFVIMVLLALEAARYISGQLPVLSSLVNAEQTIATISDLGRLGSLAVFLILFGVMLMRRSFHRNQNPVAAVPVFQSTRRLWLSWLAGFLLVAVPTMVVIIHVDPTGMYNTKIYNSRVVCGRDEKATSYLALSETPDIVILGTSYAFTISPEHIRRTLHYSAFNASVAQGLAPDNLIMAKFIYDHSKDNPPKVLLVNVTLPLAISPGITPICTPFYLLPYMTLPTVILTIQSRLQGLFDSQEWSEALYLLRYYDLFGPPPPLWTFDPVDGEGMAKPSPNLDSLLNSVVSTIGMGPKSEVTAPCKLDESGVQQTLELVALVKKFGSSIVFFDSPLHPRYLQALEEQTPSTDRCHEALVDFMRDLVQQHDHVFFLDYYRLASINGIDTGEGYYDVGHMTEENNNRLIDASATTIREAYARAIQKRLRPT